jgi:hypothetical protein
MTGAVIRIDDGYIIAEVSQYLRYYWFSGPDFE